MTDSQSRVTLTFTANGTKAAVTNIESVSSALEDLTDAATAANDALAASTEATAASVGASQAAIGASAQETAAKVTAAADEAAAASTEQAAATTAASDDIVEANTRVAASAQATSKSVLSANQGVMGLLTSFKTLAVGAGVYGSVKVFSGYETALTRLSTLAGLTQKQLAGVSSEIDKMARGLGQTPTALANAMYSPVSEGFGVKASEQVAASAAKLSGISGAPISGTGSTSYAISTMLQTLGLKPTAANIAKVTGLIRGAVGAGDMQMTDFLGAASTGIFNTGKTYGISAQDTVGALDYFTSQGVPATQAATRMRMTLALLTGQSASAAQYGQALGLDTTNTSESALSQQLTGLGLSPTKMTNVVDKSGGLAKAFEMINQSMATLPHDQQVALWAKLFGGGRSDTTAMTLAQGAADGSLQEFTNRAAALSSPAATNQAWATYQQTPAYEFAQLKSQASQLAQQIGKALMPSVRALITVLHPFLDFAASNIGSSIVAGLLLGAGLKKAFTLATAGLDAFRIALGLDTTATDRQAGSSVLGSGAGAGEKVLGGAGAGEGLAAAGGGTVSALALPVAGGAAIAGLIAYGAYTGLNPNSINKYAAADEAYGIKGPLNLQKLANMKLPPGMAAGGVMGMVNTPTAIVGEGNPHHPEFVIPTDPSYRSRALGLYAQLGTHLMASGGTLANPQQSSAGAWDSYLSTNPYVAMAMAATAAASSAKGGTGSAADNKTLGQRLAAAMGWTGNEWTALNALFTQESGWNNLARNPSSGAYGIAQALPATKYPLAGQQAGGSSAQAQIQWGLNYIKSRYGDPLAAEAHENNMHWYARGGTWPAVKPLLFDSGGILPEGLSAVMNKTGAPEPLQRVGAGSSTTGGDTHVHVEIDGREVGRAVIKNVQDRVARS